MNFKKNKKGFTFIELMIAVFIFALMMVAVTGIFSSSISGYQKARNVQKNLEDAQFVMNQMAKILRTSSIVLPAGNNITGNQLVVYDYSQGKCFKYAFTIIDGNKIKFGKIDAPPAGSTQERKDFEKDPIAWCGSKTFGALNPMAALNVTGRFNSAKSDATSGVLGKITISMSVCSNAGCTGDKVNIQTSVSLRDYYNAGI